MSIELENLASGFSTGIINDNFRRLEEYINDNLLNRDGTESGEANQMELPLDMNSHPILNAVTDPNNPGSLLTQEYADERYVNTAGDTMTGSLDMGGNDIGGVGTTRTRSLIVGGIPVKPPTDLEVPYVIYVDTIADLQALDTSGLVDGQAASVQGSDFLWEGGEWSPVGAVSVKAFGAMGDDSSDDTAAIQACIDYCFQREKPVFLPRGIYKTTKPIIIKGRRTGSFPEQGATIIGEGLYSSTIKKYGQGVRDDLESPYDADAIVIIADEFLRGQSGYASAVTVSIRDISMFCSPSEDRSEYGMYVPDAMVYADFKNLNVENADRCFVFSGDTWLSTFQSLKAKDCVNGFEFRGINTSCHMQGWYVNICSGVAYDLGGIYSTIYQSAADNCTGIVYALKGFQGTLVSPGTESTNADVVFDFRGDPPFYTACTIVNPTTFRLAKEDSVQVYMERSTNVTITGGWLGRALEGAVSPGKLVETSASGFKSSLSIDNVRVGSFEKDPDILPVYFHMSDSPHGDSGNSTTPGLPEQLLYKGRYAYDYANSRPSWYSDRFESFCDSTGMPIGEPGNRYGSFIEITDGAGLVGDATLRIELFSTGNVSGLDLDLTLFGSLGSANRQGAAAYRLINASSSSLPDVINTVEPTGNLQITSVTPSREGTTLIIDVSVGFGSGAYLAVMLKGGQKRVSMSPTHFFTGHKITVL